MARTAKAKNQRTETDLNKQILNNEQLIHLYKSMYLMRRFEIKTAKLYLELHIAGFAHLYIGQEAVAAGAIIELNDDDYVVSTYRSHAHYLMKGGDPNAIMAELCGKATGICKGKGGSMHLFDLEKGFLGGYANVGGGLPVAQGVAYSAMYRGTDQIVMAFFGDGATNGGTFHAVLNMSKIWKLPIVFICENNFYGIGTRIDRVSAVTDIYKKGEAHAIPGEQVDGMDVFAVNEAVKKAVSYVRSGNGPYFIEARTWRFRGHSMTDPDSYRPKDDKESWRDKDPIPKLKEFMLAEKIISETDFDKIDAQVNESVRRAADFAIASPLPSPDALYEDVYA